MVDYKKLKPGDVIYDDNDGLGGFHYYYGVFEKYEEIETDWGREIKIWAYWLNRMTWDSTILYTYNYAENKLELVKDIHILKKISKYRNCPETLLKRIKKTFVW